MVRAASERGELRAGVDEDLVLSLLTVVLRHLNSAPFDPAGDVAIPFHELADRRGRPLGARLRRRPGGGVRALDRWYDHMVI